VRFETEDCCLVLDVPAEVIDRMYSESASAPDREAGGVLLGRYSDDLRIAMVLEATRAPSDSLRLPTTFVRGTSRLGSLLRRLWARAPRTYYLGEWHYHPAMSSAPSGADEAQMKTIASCVAYACPEPILLIIGRRAPQSVGPNVSATIFTASAVHHLFEVDSQP